MDFVRNYKHAMDEFKPTPIYCFPYIQRVLKEEFAKQTPRYPQDILIPQSTEEMLKGNMEPLKVIHLDSPVMWEDCPIWFGDSRKEVFLRYGYVNLDARYISNVALGSDVLHGFLGGATGHGKSVAINALMCALFMEYAPWELNVHLSDAKILEFKKYGVNHKIPHIKTIAATEDADFVISVLENAVTEMKNRQALFGNLGTSNIKDFRKKTNLALPRVLILMDEVETSFQLAGKKSSNIAEAVNAFTKLGRATGFNLLMATQNYSSDIPAGAMNQISLRMCLGASESTSEKILGNKGAAENLGKVGRMVVNTDTLMGGDTIKSNVKYQLPFLRDEDFEEEMRFLEQKGKEVGYPAHMSFYDETDIKTYTEMDVIISSIRKRRDDKHDIILGYPAFVTDDLDGMLRFTLDFEDIENIMIVSPLALNIATLLKILSSNLKDEFTWLILSNKDAFLGLFDNAIKKLVRSTEQSEYSIVHYTVNTRIAMLTMDELINRVSDNEVEAARETLKMTAGIEFYADNDLMCRRFHIYSNIKKYPAFGKTSEELLKWFPTFKLLTTKFEQYKALHTPLTKSGLNKVIIVIGDLNKIIGLGRDSKSKQVESLKQMMQDAYRVNVVFVLYASTVMDVNALCSAVRYTITESIDSREFGRLKIDDPGEIKDVLCVLYDALATKETDKLRKFKRSESK